MRQIWKSFRALYFASLMMLIGSGLLSTYLALRLAALSLHLEKTAALPFIADDLFINYDDGRARAGLEALARLSESTQVIFLSHHAHLVPVVQAVFGAQVNVVQLD